MCECGECHTDAHSFLLLTSASNEKVNESFVYLCILIITFVASKLKGKLKRKKN